MATATDRTFFRTISADGEQRGEAEAPKHGNTVDTFDMYALAVLDEGSTDIAQWIVENEEGDICAEARTYAGDEFHTVLAYPAADIFN
jgi:hypothetical protein